MAEIRKTIRINPELQLKIKTVLKTGEFYMESELLRRALNIGLDSLIRKGGK